LGVMWLENLRHVFSNCVVILVTLTWLDFLKFYLILIVFHLYG